MLNYTFYSGKDLLHLRKAMPQKRLAALLLMIFNGVTLVTPMSFYGDAVSLYGDGSRSTYYRSGGSSYGSDRGAGTGGGMGGAGFMSDMFAGAASDMLMMGGGRGVQQSKCVDIPINLTLCRDIGYTQMRLPNLLEHDTLREVCERFVFTVCHWNDSHLAGVTVFLKVVI